MSQTTVPSNAFQPAYRVLNPATGEVGEEFPTATQDEINRSIGSADTAFQAWKNVPMQERAQKVLRIA